MPSFLYLATDDQRMRTQGSIDASSEDEAREMLRKQGLTVEEVRMQNPMPWSDTEEAADRKTSDAAYIPLSDTLRMFAGWLLAWYGVIYALGALQLNEKISSEIPFIQALFSSPVILRLAFATYLFLLLGSIHRLLGRGAVKGIILTIIGVAALAWLYVNT